MKERERQTDRQTGRQDNRQIDKDFVHLLSIIKRKDQSIREYAYIK